MEEPFGRKVEEKDVFFGAGPANELADSGANQVWTARPRAEMTLEKLSERLFGFSLVCSKSAGGRFAVEEPETEGGQHLQMRCSTTTDRRMRARPSQPASPPLLVSASHTASRTF